ncbi:MAG: transketolase family protein [Actinomycetota bacterium]|nr:transketolase family protein [Actinomycetota bacterium]
MKESAPTRDAYGEQLVILGKENKNVVVVEADISKSTRTCYFASKFPDRFFNVGVAEQNEAMIAAGLASCGLIPFMSTYAVFGSMRCCEQIRTFICYTNLNVKIAVSHGGLTPGNDGVTHQGTVDIGVLRSFPNLAIIMPTDFNMAKAAVKEAASYVGPVYLRFTRDAVPLIYKEDINFKIGKAIKLREGKDITIVTFGDMTWYCLKAAEILEKDGIAAEVIDMPTLKPLDEKSIIMAAKETGAIVTVEDHQIIGGLGSAVAEVLSENHPVLVKRIGLKNTFAQSGEYEVLLKKYGLATDNIVSACREILKKK